MMNKSKDYEGLYYIQDTRQIVGNNVSFWRHDGNGYTCHINQAGLYNLEQVMDICSKRETDKPLSAQLVHKCATLQLDIQLLRKELDNE